MNYCNMAGRIERDRLDVEACDFNRIVVCVTADQRVTSLYDKKRRKSYCVI